MATRGFVKRETNKRSAGRRKQRTLAQYFGQKLPRIPTAKKIVTMPNFGAIKALQARMGGCDRATAKKALEENGDDEDAAAKHIADTTDFKDTRTPADQQADPLSRLNLADHLAGRPVLEELEENTKVSIIRIEEGDRETYPGYGDTLRVHYKGMLADDGTVFDSSYERNAPMDFKFGKREVIVGWDDAFAKMSLGEKALLVRMAAAC